MITFARMEYKATEIEGVYIIEPRVFNDARGYFFEAFKQSEFEEHIGKVNFIQDNESKSGYGVLRGLHYQKDIRKSSPTFGKHVMVELSDENKRQFFIPRGFAHGFLVLSDEAIFTYKVDNVYAPQAEASIRFDDPDLGIVWPINQQDVLTSEKDLKANAFRDAEYFE